MSLPPCLKIPEYELAFSEFVKHFETGEFFDLMVITSRKSFCVHKVIVFSRCPILRQHLKKPSANVLFLHEDSDLIGHLINFVYKLDYHIPAEDNSKNVLKRKLSSTGLSAITDDNRPLARPKISSSNNNRFEGAPVAETLFRVTMRPRHTEDTTQIKTQDDSPNSDNLLIHIKMYELAAQYNLPALQILATKKFAEEVKVAWDTVGFVRAIRRIYMMEPREDRALRDIVLQVFVQHEWLGEKTEIEEMACDKEMIDFTFDLYRSGQMAKKVKIKKEEP